MAGDGYLYVDTIGFSFRARGLDSAHRINRAAQEAARKAIDDHRETIGAATLETSAIRAHESNYAPKRKGAT